MKVLIINASPRKEGITSTLIEEINASIKSIHNVETVRIQDLNIKPCLGCLKCRPDKVCVLPKDDAHMLAEKIKDSDILIIGSPVYWGNMPGTLKILFDRIVSTFRSLKTVLGAGGIKITSVLNVPDSYNFEKKRHHYLNKARKLAISI